MDDQFAQVPVLRAAIFGASGGIGRALVAALREDGRYGEVFAGARVAPEGMGGFAFDLTDEASIAAAADRIGGPLDLVIVASGILQDVGRGIAPEKSLRALDASAMARLFAINTIGPALIAKHFLPLMRREGRSVFAALSARVGSVSDNRLGGWHSYRASKAALNMLIANFAIEQARGRPDGIVVALHPGTVATELSAPFQRGVTPEKLFTPRQSAEHLLRSIDALTPADSGGLFGWDGARIPF